LEGSIRLDHAGPVHSGADAKATIVVHNTGSMDLTVQVPATGAVVKAGTTRVVGATEMVAYASGPTVTAIPAGGTVELPVTIGTTTCSPDGPPGTHPGTYDMVATVSVPGEAAQPIAFVVRGPITVSGDSQP
jgi:hypothetical protein